MNTKRNPYFRFLTIAFVAALLGGCAEELNLCPDDNHPHAIDLGLPNGTKWSCCNLGAPSPEHSGGYYAWGETDVKSTYDDNYECPNFLDDIARTKYDAAYIKWGDDWQTPNYEQASELINYCKIQESATYNGVKGYLFTGPSGNSIFLPFCGYMNNDELLAEFQGYIWTSTFHNAPGSIMRQSELLKFNNKSAFLEILPCEWGLNIRPVTK